MTEYEILFLSQDRIWENLKPQKGYPVTFQESGQYWGPKCTNPQSFIRVKVPAEFDEISKIFGGWNRRTTYEITAFDPVTDTFGVKMFADIETVKGSKKEGELNVADVEQFLSDWGAVVKHDESAPNDVRFTLKAIDALEGKGYIYFGKEDDYVIFTESFYDPMEGLHRIDADYSNSILTKEQVEVTIASAGATLISIDHDKGLFTFETTRDIMREKLEEAVRNNFDNAVSIARYYLPESYVDAAITAGGLVEEPDLDTLKSKLIDKFVEV